MKRGTVVLAKFPFTDLSSYKRRPAVIISKNGKNNNDYIVAFITSIIPENLSDTDLLFSSSQNDFKKSGLTKTSVIKADKLATLNKFVFTGELGNLSTGQ